MKPNNIEFNSMNNCFSHINIFQKQHQHLIKNGFKKLFFVLPESISERDYVMTDSLCSMYVVCRMYVVCVCGNLQN